ncbi:DUF3341 domain-containing protein [bacterium]|jgi:hypothetical protein|nr:DUF3341 domain-containing protein [bacterium]
MSHAESKGPELAGVVGFFSSPETLLKATQKTREAKYKHFDAYSPFPIHGLEKAQGLKRSPLPYVTFLAGLTGGCIGFGFQYWTSAINWPLNVGGKPFNSWPAFIPVTFELTVLLAGLSTVGAMFFLNGLPNIKKKAFDPGITRDKFALMIEAPPGFGQASDDDEYFDGVTPVKKKVVDTGTAFEVSSATSFLKGLGATDIKTVYNEGWF